MILYFIENLLPLFTLVYVISNEIKNNFDVSNLTHSHLLLNDSTLLSFCS